MLETTRNKQVWVWWNRNCYSWLRKFIGANLYTIAPVPNKKAFIIRITKWDQKFSIRCELEAFNAVLVTLQCFLFCISCCLFLIFVLFLGLRFYCRAFLILLKIFISNFPDCNLRRLKRRLASCQVFAIAGKCTAVEWLGRRWAEEMDLFARRGVEHN